MSTTKTLDDHTADDLRDALGRMNTSTITQVLPMSEIRPNEGLHTRDYLVIYEEVAPVLGTPRPTVMFDSREQAALYVEENIEPATTRQEVQIQDNRHSKYQGFEAWVDHNGEAGGDCLAVRVGKGATVAAAVADYLDNVTAEIEQLQEVQAALGAGNFTT